MGRLSKSIAGEVRLRFPSWTAWAVASIVLCPTFAGGGDARAQAINISPAIATPKLPAINVSPAIATPKLPAIVTPKLHVSTPGLIAAKAGINSIPGGGLGPVGSNVLARSRSPVGGSSTPAACQRRCRGNRGNVGFASNPWWRYTRGSARWRGSTRAASLCTRILWQQYGVWTLPISSLPLGTQRAKRLAGSTLFDSRRVDRHFFI